LKKDFQSWQKYESQATSSRSSAWNVLLYIQLSSAQTTYENSLLLKDDLQVAAEKLGAEVEFIGRTEDDDDEGRLTSNYGFKIYHHSGDLHPKQLGIVLNNLYVKYTNGDVDVSNTMVTPTMGLHLPVNFLVDFSDGTATFVNQFINQYFVNIAGTDLHNIHKQIQHIDAIFIDDDVKSGGLGLMLVEDLVNVSGIKQTLQWRNIITKHLKNERDVLDCKAELIEKGYSTLAKL